MNWTPHSPHMACARKFTLRRRPIPPQFGPTFQGSHLPISLAPRQQCRPIPSPTKSSSRRSLRHSPTSAQAAHHCLLQVTRAVDQLLHPFETTDFFCHFSSPILSCWNSSMTDPVRRRRRSGCQAPLTPHKYPSPEKMCCLPKPTLFVQRLHSILRRFRCRSSSAVCVREPHRKVPSTCLIQLNVRHLPPNHLVHDVPLLRLFHCLALDVASFFEKLIRHCSSHLPDVVLADTNVCLIRARTRMFRNRREYCAPNTSPSSFLNASISA